jgi:hypothetical protein
MATYKEMHRIAHDPAAVAKRLFSTTHHEWTDFLKNVVYKGPEPISMRQREVLLMLRDETEYHSTISGVSIRNLMAEKQDAEFNQHRSRFYALIGHCVTRYQAVEDYLPELFAAALGGNAGKAVAIFAVARGLEAKLNLVSAALIDADKQHQSRWADLLRRIASAAMARNEIAHARPAHRVEITAFVSRGSQVSPKAPVLSTRRMELRKRTRGCETVWTANLMAAEHQRTDKLFCHMIALAMELRGEKPPAHLLEK